MSDIEQITNNSPSEKSGSVKVKDPKKVAAGKKLAEYNKKAKDALAREMKRDAAEREDQGELDESETNSGGPWIPELSFTTVISVVGLGFTAIDLFFRYYKKNTVDLPTKVPDSFKDPPQPDLPHPSKIPVPKIGME